MTRPIVVYANHFRETSGGVIVLHLLVDRLRAIGVDAYLMPYDANPYARRWGRVARKVGFQGSQHRGSVGYWVGR